MLTGRELLITLANKHQGDWHRVYSAIQAKDCEDITHVEGDQRCITLLDEVYPDSLKRTYQAPLVLFYKGDISLLSEKDSIAIIGKREPTGEGEMFTDEFIRSCIASDRVIITTLAKGIGATATLSALESGHKVIAVLGSGIDYCYPECNKDLYDRIIAEGGLVISEYPFSTAPTMHSFPMRNRIVVGLAESVCSIEANPQSGTAIALTMALSQNKPIFAKPNPMAKNDYNNRLIDEGANCLTLDTTI